MTYKISKNETALLDTAVTNLLNETQKEYIDIVEIPEEKELDIFESKIGGVPYLPHDVEVPRSSDGRQLGFLAQIDCSDLPENDIYPKKGLLQFWIGRDALFGLEDKKGSKVLYFEEIDTSLKKEDILRKYDLLDENNSYEYSPISPKNSNFSLDLKTKTAPINQSVYNFEKLLIENINKVAPEKNITDLFEDLENEAYEHALNYFTTSGSQIGGYPSFSQYDPREEDSDKNIVLLQLSCMYNLANFIEIIWGDDGVANFLISKEDLKNLNFDNVLYTWDCY